MNANNVCITNYDRNNIEAIDKFIGVIENENNSKHHKVTITKESRKKCASALVR